MTAENSQRALARPHFSSGVHWPLGCPLGLFIGRSPVRNFHRAGRRPLGILIGRTTDQKSQRASSSFFTARSGASSGADRSDIPAGIPKPAGISQRAHDHSDVPAGKRRRPSRKKEIPSGRAPAQFDAAFMRRGDFNFQCPPMSPADLGRRTRLDEV